MLTAHTQPRMRVDGRLGPIAGSRELSPEGLEQQINAMLPPEMLAELYERKELDFSFAYRRDAPLPRQLLLPAGQRRAVAARDPARDPVVRRAAAAARVRVLLQPPAGSRARDRPDRLGQVDDARVDDRLHQRAPRVPHPHDRGPDRVRAPAQGRRRQPARGRLRHRLVRARRCAPRSARTPTSILVGEMRDPETIQFALTLAETGHLVFATLHTNDAAQALDRIWDVFPHERQTQIRVQLAASLAGRHLATTRPEDRRRHGRRVRGAHRQGMRSATSSARARRTSSAT